MSSCPVYAAHKIASFFGRAPAGRGGWGEFLDKLAYFYVKKKPAREELSAFAEAEAPRGKREKALWAVEAFLRTSAALAAWKPKTAFVVFNEAGEVVDIARAPPERCYAALAVQPDLYIPHGVAVEVKARPPDSYVLHQLAAFSYAYSIIRLVVILPEEEAAYEEAYEAKMLYKEREEVWKKIVELKTEPRPLGGEVYLSL